MQIDNSGINLADVISKAWKVYTKHFISILLVTVIVYIPINFILYLIPLESDSYGGISRYYRISQALENLFGIIAYYAVIFITAKALDGKDLKFGEALKLSFSNWGGGILTNIVRGIILLGLTLLLIVPGVIWFIYYAFTAQAVTLGNLRYKAALDYSKSLVKGIWWKTLGYCLVILLLPAIPVFIIVIPADILSNSYYGIEPVEIFVNTIADIITSFMAVGMTVFYMDLQRYKQTNPPIPDFYSKMNSIVNPASKIDDSPDLNEENSCENDR